MSEIFAQRIGDRVLVPDQQTDGPVEPFDARFGAQRTGLEVRLTLTLQDGSHCAADVCALDWFGRCNAHLNALSRGG